MTRSPRTASRGPAATTPRTWGPGLLGYPKGIVIDVEIDVDVDTHRYTGSFQKWGAPFGEPLEEGS